MGEASESVLVERVGGWLKSLGTKRFELSLLTGDVSPRRYLRVRYGPESAIVAAYPESMLETARRFADTTRLLTAAEVRVPEVLAFDATAGLMLLEDAGEETLFDRRDHGWDHVAPYLEAARQAVLRLQRIDPAAVGAINPPLDAEALMRELEMTWELHLEPHGLCGSGEVRDLLHACLSKLCQRLGGAGRVPCHRDFMARNLVPLADRREVVVLDHQDLRLGPPAYDLASLTNDSLFLSVEQRVQIAGEESAASLDYRRCAAQRSLKIVGTFVSFSLRGSPRYLPWVDRCVARSFDYLTSLPEGEGLAAPLRSIWKPTLTA